MLEDLNKVKKLYKRCTFFVYEDLNIINGLILINLFMLNAKIGFTIVDAALSLVAAAIVLLFVIAKTHERMEGEK